MNSWPLKQLAVGNDSECVYRAVAATLRPDPCLATPLAILDWAAKAAFSVHPVHRSSRRLEFQLPLPGLCALCAKCVLPCFLPCFAGDYGLKISWGLPINEMK